MVVSWEWQHKETTHKCIDEQNRHRLLTKKISHRSSVYRDNVRKGAKKKVDFHNLYLCYVDNSLHSFVFNVCLLACHF